MAAFRRLGASLALALCAAPVHAQSWLDGLEMGPVLEVGGFAYGRHRYQGDTEVRFSAALGYRVQRDFLFLEPHVRAVGGLDGWAEGEIDCDEVFCAELRGAIDPIPVVWTGATVGVVLGDQFHSQSLALRGALGHGDRLTPLVGVRYEASARRAAWFVEGSLESVRWKDSFSDARSTDRWVGGVSTGFRFWLRPVTVPAPKTPGDAGIIGPEPARPKD